MKNLKRHLKMSFIKEQEDAPKRKKNSQRRVHQQPLYLSLSPSLIPFIHQKIKESPEQMYL
ncbi:hypothetical protein YC2023_090117 [Brassica napus]